MSYVNVQDRRLPFALRYVGDLMAYRHLCWNLVTSDLRARFRRTKLGILWAIIQPLALALMIAAVWGVLQRTAGYMEYASYVLAGMVAFDLFGGAVGGGQDALKRAKGFVTQARVPFLIFQVRAVLSNVMMFMFGLAAIAILTLATGQFPAPGSHLLLIPAFLIIAILFTLPIVIVMSLVGAFYRDVGYISMLAERAIWFMSPVMLPREVLQVPHLQFLEFANPLVPFLDLFRDPVLYGRLWEAQDLIVMSIWIVALWAIAMISASSAGRKVVFAL